MGSLKLPGEYSPRLEAQNPPHPGWVIPRSMAHFVLVRCPDERGHPLTRCFLPGLECFWTGRSVCVFSKAGNGAYAQVHLVTASSSLQWSSSPRNHDDDLPSYPPSIHSFAPSLPLGSPTSLGNVFELSNQKIATRRGLTMELRVTDWNLCK
ncbi:hypothetical protein FA13DRAFT_757907 [Coprinellus micaceus]|uniref:Uncharacterized protein n=1 Tax=Coprinellus micaceus TaxID=71717 RepID=A0A4Y7T3M9_COPMI|nr:hypothetical protein FA13DRAFT_757907 [Coprinellus micaceus]